MNNILRLLGISLFGLVLAACNLQPATPTAPAEPEIEPQANFYKQFGGQVNNGTNGQPSMALDSSGNPVVSWSESDGTSYNYNTYVKRWNGSSWVQLGGGLNVNTNYAQNPSLAVDSSGNPVVTWIECFSHNGRCVENSFYNVYIKRWNGISWVQLGTSLNVDTNQHANYPSLAIDSSGNPVVSWSEFDGTSSNIHVKRWNGTSWVQVGGALDTNVAQDATAPSLALTSSGNPVVAWMENDGTSTNIYVRSYVTLFNRGRWTDAQLLDVNPHVNPNLNAYYPSLALDNSGNPVVSWSECIDFNIFGNCTNNNIYVKRLSGGIWTQVGTAWDVDVNQDVAQPSLALDSAGNPVVAWTECSTIGSGPCTNLNVYVKGYFKNAFKPFANSLDKVPELDGIDPSITLDNNNSPVAAWSESASGTNLSLINVSRWVGNAWSSIPAVNYNGFLERGKNPSIAVEKSTNINAFNPVVAWAEEVGILTGQTHYNIYAKRWNGAAWVEYLANAPLDRTASNNATEPVLALDSTNKPYIAWVEVVNGSRNIYVKRWNGTAWAWVGTAAALDIAIGNSVGAPSMAIGSDNKPVIAWAEEDAGGNSNVYVKKLVGNTWTLVGTTAIDRSIANYAFEPSLDLDSSNNPMVAWREDLASGDSNIYAKRWNGSSWVSLGNILDKLPSNPAGSPSLVIGTNNNPVVSWDEFDLPGSDTFNVYVKRWTGTAWQSVSTGAVDVNLANNADKPSMVLNAANNPIVAWQESTSSQGQNIYVKGF
jgi:hypothetical protein